jgi:IS6 family transposase
MMAERGLSLDDSRIARWVLRYAPILSQRIRCEMRRPNCSWRVDETYVRGAGRWTYLYRAVDSEGNMIDFMLSPNRDLTAAKHFLQLALWRTGEVRPRVINVDGHPAYARAIGELRSSGELGPRCRCRPSTIALSRSASWRVLGSARWRGHYRRLLANEAMHAIRKGQIRWLSKGGCRSSPIHPTDPRHCRLITVSSPYRRLPMLFATHP